MAHISCENEFCIYQKEGTCILENIRLDTQDNCTECICVNMEEVALTTLKEKLLRQLS